MAPEVIQTLIGRLPPGQAAHLRGAFRRHPVQNYFFPGLVRAEDESTAQPVKGVLYKDLSVNEMKRLDWFEGDEYDKISCEVEVADSSEMVETQVYLWVKPIEELDVTQSWSYEQFREQNLEKYLEQTVRPCRDHLDRIMKD